MRVDAQRVHHISRSRADHTLITFTRGDVEGLRHPHNDALVITLNIDGWEVNKVLVDPGSPLQIMFKKTLDKMESRKQVLRRSMEVVGFDGTKAKALGEITLSRIVADQELEVPFMIVSA